MAKTKKAQLKKNLRDFEKAHGHGVTRRYEKEFDKYLENTPEEK